MGYSVQVLMGTDSRMPVQVRRTSTWVESRRYKGPNFKENEIMNITEFLSSLTVWDVAKWSITFIVGLFVAKVLLVFLVIFVASLVSVLRGKRR